MNVSLYCNIVELLWQEDFEQSWNHIAYVRANDRLYLYINGVEVFSEDIYGAIPNPSGDLIIGGAFNNPLFLTRKSPPFVTK